MNFRIVKKVEEEFELVNGETYEVELTESLKEWLFKRVEEETSFIRKMSIEEYADWVIEQDTFYPNSEMPEEEEYETREEFEEALEQWLADNGGLILGDAQWIADTLDIGSGRLQFTAEEECLPVYLGIRGLECEELYIEMLEWLEEGSQIEGEAVEVYPYNEYHSVEPCRSEVIQYEVEPIYEYGHKHSIKSIKRKASELGLKYEVGA